MGCGSSAFLNRAEKSIFQVKRKANTIKNAARESRSSDIEDGKECHDGALSACVAPHASSFKTISGRNVILGQNDRTTKLKDLLIHSDTATDTLRMSRAAIMIQRIARGKSARGSMSQRRISSLAENKFLESIDPYLSPAENACKSLMHLALVTKSSPRLKSIYFCLP